jgi:hypothetical protein
MSASTTARNMWHTMWGTQATSRVYHAVPDSPSATTPTTPSSSMAVPIHGRSPQTQRRGLRSLRRPGVVGALVLAFLAIFAWDVHRPQSTIQDLWRQTGFLQSSYGYAPAQASAHREPVSVILMAGRNDHQVLESARSVLATTVGPYELIGEEGERSSIRLQLTPRRVHRPKRPVAENSGSASGSPSRSAGRQARAGHDAVYESECLVAGYICAAQGAG